MEAVTELSDSKGSIARAQENCDKLIGLMERCDARSGYIQFVEGCMHVYGCEPENLATAPGYPFLVLAGADPVNQQRGVVARLVYEELKSLLQKPIEWVKDSLLPQFVLTFKMNDATIHVRWRNRCWLALIGDGPERSHLFA